MGKGDQKSKRGKIVAGTYGKKRPRKSSQSVAAVVEKASKVKSPKAEAKPKTAKAKAEAVGEEKPKTTRKKKTEE